jgi:fatty acid desaturase
MTTTADAPVTTDTTTDQATETTEAPVSTIGHGPYRLSPEQLEEFGAELDAIRQRVIADLGQADADYIRGIVKAQRAFEGAGRALFYLPPAWPLAVGALSVSKILDNMEIGHNVMHGQYDWMGDPGLNSRMYEWDTVCPSEQWKYSHNYIHHTYTNILGKDRDIGYGILRMDEDQPWKPYYLGNPLYALGLMTFFQWGVLLHDLEVENIMSGKRSWKDTKHLHRGMIRKVRSQTLKDYVLFPALTGPLFPLTLAGNATANLIRNIWTFNIIFCGHFPAGVESFSMEETEDETRGGWYYRQLLGSANITGRKLFHTLTGNLSFQIEHHLFPDIPARRYPEIAPEIEALCDKYGLDYNTGPLHKQLGSVAAKIIRFAVPPRPSRQQLASVTPLRFFTRSSEAAADQGDQHAGAGARPVPSERVSL